VVQAARSDAARRHHPRAHRARRNELSRTKSDKTVKNSYGIIATAFKVAIQDGHLPETPCKRITLPRRTDHENAEMRFLTHEEWLRLHAALLQHYRPLFTFLIGTGLRWGEAEALQVRDVELAPSPVVRVTKAAKWNASKASRDIGPTKTRKSRRTVTLPTEVVEAVGNTYTALISVRSGTNPRSVEVRLQWLTSGDSFISQEFGIPVTSTTSGWTQESVTGVARATAAKARIAVCINAPVVPGEVHYLDKAGLMEGSTTTWAAP
jgi:integrase